MQVILHQSMNLRLLMPDLRTWAVGNSQSRGLVPYLLPVRMRAITARFRFHRRLRYRTEHRRLGHRLTAGLMRTMSNLSTADLAHM
jgi:hypothetical protein